MGRAIVAFVAGILAWYLVLNITMTIAYFSLGADRAYLPDSYVVSALWVAVMLIMGLLASIAGGWICRRIARRPGPVWGLIVLIVAFGALSASFEMMERADDARAGAAPAPAVRPADEPFMETMVKSKLPIWSMWANPALGFAGLMIGGFLLAGPCRTSGKSEAAPV